MWRIRIEFRGLLSLETQEPRSPAMVVVAGDPLHLPG
jgi:hypothetical protein